MKNRAPGNNTDKNQSFKHWLVNQTRIEIKVGFYLTIISTIALLPELPLTIKIWTIFGVTFTIFMAIVLSYAIFRRRANLTRGSPDPRNCTQTNPTVNEDDTNLEEIKALVKRTNDLIIETFREGLLKPLIFKLPEHDKIFEAFEFILVGCTDKNSFDKKVLDCFYACLHLMQLENNFIKFIVTESQTTVPEASVDSIFAYIIKVILKDPEIKAIIGRTGIRRIHYQMGRRIESQRISCDSVHRALIKLDKIRENAQLYEIIRRYGNNPLQP